MILGIGTDLVAVPRVEEVLSRHRQRFLDRVFTPAEQADCLGRARPAMHLAARLAAKEAAMKALGTGWGLGVRWQAMVSLSHDGDYAIAVVVATD